MALAHRQDDNRSDGDKTVVTGQSTVFVNGKLWAVENDQDTSGNGQLISSVGSTVTINGKKVIVQGDQAQPCNKPTPNPYPTSFSSNVQAYQ